MTHYLLPCSCSCRIPVGPGQAGDTAACPQCGATLCVPRLGELARLEPAEAVPAGGTGRGWTTARACLLAGVVLALVAAGTGSWLRGQRLGVAPLDEEAIRSGVAAAPAEQVHASWLEFERQGIERPPVVEEERRIRQARALRSLETIAWLAAAVGAAVGGAAALAVVMGRPAGGTQRG